MTGSWKGRMRIRVSVLKIQTSCFEYRNPSLPSPGYSPEAEKNPLWCPVSKDTLFLHEVMRGSCLTAGWKRKARNLMAFHRIFSVPASLLLFKVLVLLVPEDSTRHFTNKPCRPLTNTREQFLFSGKLFAIPPPPFFVFIDYGLGF